MADVVAIHQQLQEVRMMTSMYGDLELAYHMQLEEALAASIREVERSSSGGEGGDSSFKDELPKPRPIVVDRDTRSSISNLTSVMEVQTAELLRLEQEAKDQQQAMAEAQGLLQDMWRRHHDREFAKSVADMSEDQWEETGDIFERPFHKIDEDEWDESQVCRLFTGRACEESGHVAIGWSVTDTDGRVLLEQSKYLGIEVSAATADYTALLEGLGVALAAGVRNILFCCSSLAVYGQIIGKWSAKPKQARFLEQVQSRSELLEQFDVEYLPKEKNSHCTDLALEAIRIHKEARSRRREKLKGVPPSDQESKSVLECPICVEKVPFSEAFEVKGCLHTCCIGCISQHLRIRVKSNQVPVKCPQDCSNVLEIEECRGILAPDLVELYAKSLAEASIPVAERVYCPFANCSSLMCKSDLVPSAEASTSRRSSTPTVRCTECMECHRLFCAECRVPWHVDMSCEAYQRLPSDMRDAEDIKLYNLASNNNWQRCTKCRRVIELDQGCYHMTCRCGHEFCYICGAPWVKKQATCKCKLWDEEHIVGFPLLSDDSDDESFGDSDFDDFDGLSRDSRQPFPTYKTRICRFWSSGYCRSGERCTFAHGQEELRFG